MALIEKSNVFLGRNLLRLLVYLEPYSGVTTWFFHYTAHLNTSDFIGAAF